MLLLPCPYPFARLTQDPTPYRDDKARFLRERDELLRQQKASLGVNPAYECFQSDRLATIQADYRLVVENELALVDGPLQIGRALEPIGHGRLQSRLVNLVAVLPTCLRRVHRHVRRLQDLGGALGTDLAVGDTDARVDGHGPVLYP